MDEYFIIVGNILLFWQHSDTCTDHTYATECLKRQESLIYSKIMMLLLITIIPQITQKDNSVTFSLIVIMPQINYKRVYFLLFS